MNLQTTFLGLTLWLVAIWVAIMVQWRHPNRSVGLVLGHITNMWMIYWLSVVFYLAPWYVETVFPPDAVQLGFIQSLYATLSFSAGSILCTKLVKKNQPLLPKANITVAFAQTKQVAWFYIFAGLSCRFLLAPVLGSLPGAAALLSVGWYLLLVGLTFHCWLAIKEHRRRSLIKWTVLILLIPLLTVSSDGFLGIGIAVLLLFVAFVVTFYRPRWHFAVFGVISVYFFLSVYVTYMRDREALRDQISNGASYSERFDFLYNSVRTGEAFDPYYLPHLQRIDGRLNQNALIGASVIYINDGHRDFAYGDTLIDGVLALIPRAIWPNKPMKAGSGTLVADYTGIPFNNDTTAIGVGHTMELYINFGAPGVIVGFFFIGIALTLLDWAAAQRLAEGNWPAAAFWYLTGLGFLGVASGSSIEFTVGIAAGALLVMCINRFVLPTYLRSVGRIFFKQRSEMQMGGV